MIMVNFLNKIREENKTRSVFLDAFTESQNILTRFENRT